MNPPTHLACPAPTTAGDGPDDTRGRRTSRPVRPRVAFAVRAISAVVCASFGRLSACPAATDPATTPNAPATVATRRTDTAPATTFPATPAATPATAPASAPPTTGPADYWLNRPAPFGIWGTIGVNGYFAGREVAANGENYSQLFSVDLGLNVWVWKPRGVYVFTDTSFRTQSATLGVTNAGQGSFDFSKREFDIDGGVAWNVWRSVELRAFAYSFNNLNRGNSATHPSGYDDGVGIEARYYYSPVYRDLGGADYDVARSPFVGLGYYPTKDLVDAAGVAYRPSLFGRAYLTYDLYGPQCYLYGEFQVIAARTLKSGVVELDAGVAGRPFVYFPRLELRLGVRGGENLTGHGHDFDGYVGVRYLF